MIIKENEFFADGITDDILTQLSKISDLKIISRTSVMKYKNTDLNISQISKELGAGTILEGSVRTYGDKIRIVGQLIDAKMMFIFGLKLMIENLKMYSKFNLR
jgi:adenylate cyclase